MPVQRHKLNKDLNPKTDNLKESHAVINPFSYQATRGEFVLDKTLDKCCYVFMLNVDHYYINITNVYNQVFVTAFPVIIVG